MSADLSIVQFPSKDNIISYLEQHPKSSEVDKRIIQAVAKMFANQKQSPHAVIMFVMLGIRDMAPQLNLSTRSVMTITSSITDALVDCTMGKSINSIKTAEKVAASKK